MTSFHNYNANIPQHLSNEEFEALKNLSANCNLIIQKADKGNSVVLVEKDVYIRHIEKILDDATKFKQVKIKKEILDFSINHERRINNYLKSLEKSDSLTTDQYKKIKAIGSRPGILYGLCKVHKAIIDVCPPLRPILSAIGTPSYKLAKFSVPKLSSITFNEFIVKDSILLLLKKLNIRMVNFSWVALMLTHSSLIYPLKRSLIFVPICYINT